MNGDEDTTAGPALALVVALASLQGVAARLLELHRPDDAGRCRACTTPGTGQPGAKWPCRLHGYAVLAQRLAVQVQLPEDVR